MKRIKFEDYLIMNIRIIKIGDEETITLSNEIIENTSFLLQQLRNIDKNFLLTDLKIEKSDFKIAMQKSTFY